MTKFILMRSLWVTLIMTLSAVILSPCAQAAQTPPSCAPAPTSRAVINVKNAPYYAKGDGRTDDTLAIQNAIKAMGSSGGTVYIPAGTYMINAVRYAGLIGLLVNVNDLTINMDPDAVLKALPNSSTNYEIIRITGSHVRLVGGTLMGERYAHRGTAGEWGFGVTIYGDNNFVDSVTSSLMWGDGFAVGTGGSNPLNTTICNVVADSNRRQGLSVITGDGIVIKNSTFKNTGTTALQAGHPPMSGIDIEPDRYQTAQNIEIVNSKFINNSTTGVVVTLNPAYNGQSFIRNVKIDGNVLTGNNAHWVDVSPPASIVLLNVSGMKVTNNTVTGDRYEGIHLGHAGTRSHSPATDNIITGNTVASNGRYGIVLDASSTGNFVSSNFVCHNPGGQIIDYAGGNTISGNDLSCASKALAITGFNQSSDAVNVYYTVAYTGTPAFIHLFFDTDRNPATGYASSMGIGIDRLFENGRLYQYSGAGGTADWNLWDLLKYGSFSNTGGVARITIPRSELGSPASLKVFAEIRDASQIVHTNVITQTLP